MSFPPVMVGQKSGVSMENPGQIKCKIITKVAIIHIFNYIWMAKNMVIFNGYFFISSSISYILVVVSTAWNSVITASHLSIKDFVTTASNLC